MNDRCSLAFQPGHFWGFHGHSSGMLSSQSTAARATLPVMALRVCNTLFRTLPTQFLTGTSPHLASEGLQ